MVTRALIKMEKLQTQADHFPASITTGEAVLPLVSVIIPAYNAEKYILLTIRSVLEQNYRPLEILLIDDGSTDSTAALVEREAPQVRIIRQANAGVAAARNTGLRLATGELICFVDADDGWFPGKLAAQVNYLLQQPNVGMVYHGWLVWKPDADGQYVVPQQPDFANAKKIDMERSGWIYHKLLLDCIVHTSTVMMRNQVFKNVGFFETHLSNGEDYNYWLRVSRKFEIHKLKGVYSYYREVIGSLTNTLKLQNFEYMVIQRAVKEWGLTSPDGRVLPAKRIHKRLAKLAFNFGYDHFYRGSPKIARQAFLNAIKHEPLMWRALPYIAASQLKIWRH